jgi:uroporphyrinogen decarboxylase
VGQILLCTCDPIFVKSLYGLLREDGCWVDVVDRCALAVRKALARDYDVVIMDAESVGLPADDAADIIMKTAKETAVIIVGEARASSSAVAVGRPVEPVRVREMVRRVCKPATRTPRETILKAFEGGKPDRVPVTLFGGGMWSIKGHGTSFEELGGDAGKMTDMMVAMSEKLLCDVVYAGSGYNNFHAQAFGGNIKYREMGAPDLEEHLVDTPEDLEKFDLSSLDSHDVINTVKEALRATKAKIGDEYVVTMTAWGPFTLAARFVGEEAMMKATFKKPDFVRAAIDFATDLLIHLYRPLVDDGTLDVISLADPTASGDLISKKQFRDFAVPPLKKFTDWAKAKSAHTLVHICGNTTRIPWCTSAAIPPTGST